MNKKINIEIFGLEIKIKAKSLKNKRKNLKMRDGITGKVNRSRCELNLEKGVFTLPVIPSKVNA